MANLVIVEAGMVYVGQISKVEQKDLSKRGAKNATIQWLIDDEKGAKNFAMRRLVIKKNGFTPPMHRPHNWEHEVYVLSGKGIVRIGNKEFALEKGNFVFIPPNVIHQFKNTGDKDFTFLCVMPLKGKWR